MKKWIFLAGVTAYLFNPSFAFSQDDVIVTGKVISIGQFSSSKKRVLVEVENIIRMPPNIRNAWLKSKNGKSYLSIRMAGGIDSEIFKKGEVFEFSLYPLEHTTDFGVVKVTKTEEPTNERIIFCHNQILGIKPGMNRRQVDAILKRSLNNEGVYKSQTYLGCTCGIGQVWQRNIWFKPKAIPSEIYWTVDRYENWLKQHGISQTASSPTDIVVELADANCEPKEQ
jgi:hypothetical protein